VVITFIDDHKDRFGVEPICRVLNGHGCQIAPSTYYAGKTRPASARAIRDTALLVEIERVFGHHDLGRGLAGARKVWHLLRRDATIADRFGSVARCTVERLMRQAGLQGALRSRRFVTTKPDPGAQRPPDRVNRDFSAPAPNRLWIVDFTYVPTWSGMAFTAFVSDVFSRRIVGWRTSCSMPTQLPLDALEMALWTRGRAGHTDPDGRMDGLIHHSDAGSQYTAIRYADRLADAGALASIGSVGDSFDNAMAESVIGLYKTECVRHDGPFRSVDDLELATLSWVHWFNTARLHSSLDYVTPIEHETQYYRQNDPRQQPLPGQPALH
jgi:putative transposase